VRGFVLWAFVRLPCRTIAKLYVQDLVTYI